MSAIKDSGKGLTDRKICLAVGVGIAVGVLVALLKFRTDEAAFTSLAKDSRQEYARLSKRLEQVRKENARLEEKLKKLQEQAESVGGAAAAVAAEDELDPFAPVKPGPPGTVKAPRTNPVVIPDKTLNPGLAGLLEEVGVKQEVLVAVASREVKELLELWLQQVKHLEISNTVVVALDDEAERLCRDQHIAVYRKDAAVPTQTEPGGIRLELVRDFLALGYSVLCSDLDVVLLRNPFEGGLIKGDCDVEGMSDGFDNATAYGYNDVTDDPSMGWARYAHTMRQWVINTGFVYIRPTVPSLELVDRVVARLATSQDTTDMLAFNEALWFPSNPSYMGLYASRRVLDFFAFANSKVLFKTMRRDWRFTKFTPVAVHVNFHTDKYPRMLAIVQFYVQHQRDALDPFPDGNEGKGDL